MNIIWHGQSCFEIVVPVKKETLVKIVINPFKKNSGLRLPPSLLKKVDILLLTDNFYNLENIETETFLINEPGEYEIKEIFIKGISSFSGQREEVIYTIETKGVHLCHLGDFNQKELTEEQIEKINKTEILMIPIGGNAVIGAKEALKIINQIEPLIIIPMYYYISGLNIKLDKIDKFLKEMGEKTIEPLNKLSVKKQLLTEEKTKIVILKP